MAHSVRGNRIISAACTSTGKVHSKRDTVTNDWTQTDTVFFSVFNGEMKPNKTQH